MRRMRDASLHADELDRPIKEQVVAFKCSACMNSFTMSHKWLILWVGNNKNWICSNCQKQLSPDQLALGYFKVTAGPFVDLGSILNRIKFENLSRNRYGHMIEV